MLVEGLSIFVLDEGEVAKRVRSDDYESMSVVQRLLQVFFQRIIKQIRQKTIVKKIDSNA
jgi:ATP-dependent Clp protease adapter protein ClpS